MLHKCLFKPFLHPETIEANLPKVAAADPKEVPQAALIVKVLTYRNHVAKLQKQ